MFNRYLPVTVGQNPKVGCQQRAESHYRCGNQGNYSTILIATALAPKRADRLDGPNDPQPRRRRAGAAGASGQATKPTRYRSNSNSRPSRDNRGLERL
jgi:hypothetical protein